MNSLSRRLLLAAGLVLIVFLGATGLILDKAFRESTEVAVKDRLQAYIYALLAAADVDKNSVMQMPDALPESRFSTPASGLYAQILDEYAEPIWRSDSFLGLQVSDVGITTPGEPVFSKLVSAGGHELYGLILTVAWETEQKKINRFAFQVLESTDRFNQQVARYRNNLWGWLVGLAVLLLFVQSSILRWGLSPLREIAKDLERVKKGDAESLKSDYPTEIKILTDSVNSYIEHERSQKDRYRNSLSDLAHSLKTPLAVVRSTIDGQNFPQETQNEINEQIDRMSQIVTHQLHRAGATGRSALSKSISLRTLVERLVKSLDKVYISRALRVDINIAAEVKFIGDEADLMEVLGNLLENAYKWAHGRIAVSAENKHGKESQNTCLIIKIEDDGPGIPENRIQEILKRGVRADQTVPGNGIGLAVVQDILSVYKGKLQIESSHLGGACFSIQI